MCNFSNLSAEIEIPKKILLIQFEYVENIYLKKVKNDNLKFLK